MPRNIEKDQERETQRRENILAAGLELFSQYGIEPVKLQEVADEADVGIATLYKYYTNKVNLVIAISAWMWKKVWEDFNQGLGDKVLEKYNAYQRIESYIDLVIYLYQKHPEVLRFSGYYKTYLNNEKNYSFNENEHLRVLSPITDLFHDFYEKAKVDKSIRTDIDEKEMFTAISLTMLGTAERYAQGIVWTRHGNDDYTRELLILKDMILNWVTVK